MTQTIVTSLLDWINIGINQVAANIENIRFCPSKPVRKIQFQTPVLWSKKAFYETKDYNYDYEFNHFCHFCYSKIPLKSP